MKQVLFRMALAALVLAITSAVAAAQATGGISGTARDQGGGVLPGVTLTATNIATGATRVTISNETTWPDSFAGPALIAVAQFGTDCAPEFSSTLWLAPAVKPGASLTQETATLTEAVSPPVIV